jgi:pilus assembly protein CpaF
MPVADRRERLLLVQREIHERVAGELGLRTLDPARLGDDAVWEKTETSICEMVEQMEARGALPPSVDQDALIKDILNEALGLGPLEELLGDPEVRRILVNGPESIFVQRVGQAPAAIDRSFSSEKALERVVERILGRRPGEAAPAVGEAALPDGSRVYAVLPPLAARGASLTVRKPAREVVTLAALVKQDVLSAGMTELLQIAVAARKNVLIACAQPAGVQLLLSALGSALGADERLVTVEPIATLELGRANWVALSTQPSAVDAEAALAAAMRLQPDRLIVGDVRGAEALSLVQALAAGESGALVGICAVSPRAALSRMETLMQAGAAPIAARIARELTAQAINLCVQVVRARDSFRVAQIVEVSGGAAGDPAELNEIFVAKPESDNGAAKVRFAPTGYVPRFCEDLSARGVPFNAGIFKE